MSQRFADQALLPTGAPFFSNCRIWENRSPRARRGLWAGELCSTMGPAQAARAQGFWHLVMLWVSEGEGVRVRVGVSESVSEWMSEWVSERASEWFRVLGVKGDGIDWVWHLLSFILATIFYAACILSNLSYSNLNHLGFLGFRAVG